MTPPTLVEKNVKQIMNFRLNCCRDLKFKYYNFIYNFICFIILVGVVGGILYAKSKTTTLRHRQQRENQKRDYILYNLRKFQNIKNRHITNIPQY